jgi:membrane protease YdiL (CAAX protease family)
MEPLAIALLLVVLGVLVWRATTRERREYGRFKRLRSTVARQKVMRRWLIESVLALGGLSAAVLFGAWAEIGPVLREAQAWAPVAALRDGLTTGLGTGIAAGVAVLLLAVLVVPPFLLRGSVDEIPAVGDIHAILPRTRGELPYGAGLAIQAGVIEELLFRVGLPALVFAVTGDAIVAFAGAMLVFGLLHLYQGPLGIGLSVILGAVFTLLYVVSGSILVPMVLHLIIDLRSLVLIPVLLGGVLRRPAPPAPATPSADPS